jgi:hypothetical protein
MFLGTSRVGSQGSGLRPSLKSDAVGVFVSNTPGKAQIDLRSQIPVNERNLAEVITDPSK